MNEGTLSKNVAEFMRMSEQEVRTVPCVPPEDEVRLRLRLIAEEFFELLESSLETEQALASEFDIAMRSVSEVISKAPVSVDLPEVADALADLRYVIVGTDHCFGIDGDRIDAEVHRSNISKRGAGKSEDGKWKKGPGFTPPRIDEELTRQGWRR